MADNYLERKMEEYRAGKLTGKTSMKHRGSTLIPATGYDVELLGTKRVLVVGDCLKDSGLELLKLFRSIGCKVAFCDKDSKQGSAIAQQTGCRFYPVDYDDENKLANAKENLIAHWEGLDIVIDIR